MLFVGLPLEEAPEYSTAKDVGLEGKIDIKWKRLIGWSEWWQNQNLEKGLEIFGIDWSKRES